MFKTFKRKFKDENKNGLFVKTRFKNIYSNKIELYDDEDKRFLTILDFDECDKMVIYNDKFYSVEKLHKNAWKDVKIEGNNKIEYFNRKK